MTRVNLNTLIDQCSQFALRDMTTQDIVKACTAAKIPVFRAWGEQGQPAFIDDESTSELYEYLSNHIRIEPEKAREVIQAARATGFSYELMAVWTGKSMVTIKRWENGTSKAKVWDIHTIKTRAGV